MAICIVAVLLVEYILVYIIGTTYCDHIIVATHVLCGIQIVLLLVALRIVIALVALYITFM